MATFAAVYDIGMFMSLILLYYRAGFPAIKREHDIDWRQFLLPNALWFVLFLGKVALWPLTLAVWFATGRRDSSPWKATVYLNGREVRLVARVPLDAAVAEAEAA